MGRGGIYVAAAGRSSDARIRSVNHTLESVRHAAWAMRHHRQGFLWPRSRDASGPGAIVQPTCEALSWRTRTLVVEALSLSARFLSMGWTTPGPGVDGSADGVAAVKGSTTLSWRMGTFSGRVSRSFGSRRRPLPRMVKGISIPGSRSFVATLRARSSITFGMRRASILTPRLRRFNQRVPPVTGIP